MTTATMEAEEVKAAPADLPATQDAAAKALSLIQEQCVLFVVSSHAWTGEYDMSGDVELKLDGDTVDPDLVGKSPWKLVPKSWRTRLVSFGSRAQRTVRGFAIPFIAKGQYFVSLAQSEACLTAIQAIKREQDAAVDEFVEQYPEMVDGLREKLGSKFSKVAKLLPRQDQLRDRYGLDVIPLRISLVEFLDSRKGVGVLRDAKQAASRRIMDVVNDMIEAPRRQLAEAVANLRQRIEGEKRFDDRSLEAVRKKLELLKGFGFLADDQLLRVMADLDRSLKVSTAQEVRQGGDVSRDLLTALGAVETAAAADATLGHAVAKFRRQVTLD